EGLELVRSARLRHDGFRRNPWDEVECGHHYARSMSAWMLLLALSGFSCNADRKEVNFDPITSISTQSNAFRTFWTNGLSWGIYEQHFDQESAEWTSNIRVLGGERQDY
ncbi:MAG: hypothetical protein ACK2U1_01970, partial [Anaerolineales bacterium]